METNYLKGDRIKAADEIKERFNALAAIIIIIEHGGDIKFGAANPTYQECLDAANKLKLKAAEMYL